MIVLDFVNDIGNYRHLKYVEKLERKRQKGKKA
jgi:hypothetical protein